MAALTKSTVIAVDYRLDLNTTTRHQWMTLWPSTSRP